MIRVECCFCALGIQSWISRAWNQMGDGRLGANACVQDKVEDKVGLAEMGDGSLGTNALCWPELTGFS